MWDNIGAWLVTNHGLLGLMIFILGVAVTAETIAIMWMAKRLVAQAETCRKCKEESEAKYDQSLNKFYDTMRNENSHAWEEMGKVADKIVSAITPLGAKLAELSGRLNGIGRR